MSDAAPDDRSTGTIRIGWASVDNTPSRPALLRGQRYSRVSTHVNDPVTSTALAIDTTDGDGGGDQAIIVSTDRVHLPEALHEALRDRVRPRLTDFDLSKLFVSATHTHTAPEVEEGVYEPQTPEVITPTEYAELYLDGVADAVVRAWRARRPGGISWAFGHAVVGHNRRAVYMDGSAKMYGDTNRDDFAWIEGYQDHSVDLLFLWDLEHNLTGLVVNLACPSQVTETACFVSADFWHEAREAIRTRHGNGLFILPQCAAAGDQSPHFLLYKREEAYMRQRNGVTEREEIGRRIANAVDECLEPARADVHDRLPFKHVVRAVRLSRRLVTDEELAQAKATCARLEKRQPTSPREQSQHFVERRIYRTIIERHDAQQREPTYPMELHVLRLGDVAMATNPFELFLDYGLRIKARSKALQTFVVQLAAGSGIYLPTARAVAGKSYGAQVDVSLVGPEGGQELVEHTLTQIAELWNDDSE